MHVMYSLQFNRKEPGCPWSLAGGNGKGALLQKWPPCGREDKTRQHRPQGFVRPRTLDERREVGWLWAAAHALAPGYTRAGLSKGTWTPTHREAAFCDAGYQKRLSPRLLCTPPSEHGGVGRAGGVLLWLFRSVHQTGSQPTTGSPKWADRSQLVWC